MTEQQIIDLALSSGATRGVNLGEIPVWYFDNESLQYFAGCIKQQYGSTTQDISKKVCKLVQKS